MNWFQSLFTKAAAVRSGALRVIPEWVRAIFLPVSLRRLLDGYAKNSAVSACVTRLAFSFPEAPLLVGKETLEGRFVPDYGHDLMKLIRQPNPDMGEVELMQFAITYASVGGNLYIWKQRGENGKVIHLWPFSDVNMTPVPGETTADGFVKEYEFDPGDGQSVTIPKRDVIHWKWMPDPEQPSRGIGAIEFAIRDSDRDNEASAYIYALLKNNAVPPVVVTLSEGDELTAIKANRLRKEWNQKLGGENRGNLAFLEFGMKAEKMGFDLQQLAGEALNAVPEARIAAAFQVPPVVAGLSVGLKRSDYGDQAARKAFTELTLSALWRSLASELMNGLRDDFKLPANYTLQFDLRKVRALQEEESKRWERVTLAFNRSMLTRAEAKQELGMEPANGDDVYFVSLASEFVPAGESVIRGDSGGLDTAKNAYSTTGLNETKVAGSSGSALRRIRVNVARKMQAEVQTYYRSLADRVIERAQSGGKSLKALPTPDDLIDADDNAALAAIVKRYYVQVLAASWETWNVTLGIEMAFDLDDPLVVRILGMAGRRVTEIQAETLTQLQDAVQYGAANGWSIEDLVRGDPENGIRGLRDIVEETYKDRARVIARTELGEAQNMAAAGRYREAGVDRVLIMDNGDDDDDEECKIANGQIWTLEYFEAHSLEHPNCTRAAGAYFGEEPTDRG